MKKNSLRIVASLLCVCILALAFNGCGPKPTTKGTGIIERPAEDPWVKSTSALRASNDNKACSRILTDLNMELGSRTDIERTTALTDTALANIRAIYPLKDHEANDLTAQSYSKLDAHYLADAFYLCDVVNGLQLADILMVEKSKTIFEWVCRQVVLSPWKINNQSAPPVPSSYVLRRGSGSGLERAIVFIDLCRQAGITAYLIGPESAASQPWNITPKGAFWGVGVQAGKNVLLFDPWRGGYVPGATTGRPATLAEVIKDPNVTSAWLTDTKNPWDVTAKDLQASTIFLTLPYSGFTPRMQTLEKKLQTSFGIKLYADPVVAIQEARDANPGIKVQFWPGNDTAQRAYANLLTSSDGGTAPAIRSADQSDLTDLRVAYIQSLVPVSELKFDLGLSYQEPKARLSGNSHGKIMGDFYGSPFKRELIQRNRFGEATESLMMLRDQYSTQQKLSQSPSVEKEIHEFVKEANNVYERLNSGKDVDRPYVLQEVEQLWRKHGKAVGAIVYSRIGEPGQAEATYLLAQCKHEEAEREYRKWSQAKPEVRGAMLADLNKHLKLADYWWGVYQQYTATQEPSYPGRTQHATRLAAVVQQRLIEVAK